MSVKSVQETALTITRVEDPEWSVLVREHPAGRCIVPKWEELSGWRTRRIGLSSGGKLEGGLLFGVRRIPRLPFSLSRVTCAMLPRGREAEGMALLLDELERRSNRHLVIETELRLRIPTTEGIEGFEYHDEVARVIADFGYRRLTKIDTTYLVRIDRDDDALLANFDRKARNKIRKAQKSGLVVGRSRDYRLLGELYEAYLEMNERKSAPMPPRIFIGDALVPLLERGWALLVTESYEERIASMVVVDALGVPCYTLGARTRANVTGEVAGAAQALHFELMRMFRERRKIYYDLGGCEGPVPIEGHPNYGVWRFKYGMGGTFVQFLPYYRKTRGPFLRSVLEAVHRLRGDYV